MKNRGFKIPVLLLLLFLFSNGKAPASAQSLEYTDAEYIELLARLDTVSQWIKRKPEWERLDRFQESKLFDSLSLKIEKELLSILNHPLAIEELPLNKYLNIIHSPDGKLRLINCGSANIYGTGNYYMNLVQLMDGNKVRASSFPGSLNYTRIDTIVYLDSTIYFFSGQSIHTVRFELSSYMTFTVRNMELLPYKSFGEEHSIGLIHDWQSAWYDLNFNDLFHTIDIELEIYGVYGDRTIFSLPAKEVPHDDVYPAKLDGFLFFTKGGFYWVDN